MRRDIWHGRKQFEINHKLDKRASIFKLAGKSVGASMEELTEAFYKLAKI